MSKMKLKSMQAFTLIEMAVVMSIVALLIGGMLIPLGTRYEMQAYADTQSRLDKANEALIGFAILNGRLPCPSNNSAGTELAPTLNATTLNWQCGTTLQGLSDSNTAADSSWGDLPWGSLGLAPPNNADAWNYRFRYSVRTQLAARDPTSSASLFGSGNLSASGLNVNTEAFLAPASCAVTPNCVPVVTNAVSVVFSLGKNSAGGTLIGGTDVTPNLPIANPTTAPSQMANLPNTENGTTAASRSNRSTFVSRVRSTASFAGTATEFDDVMIWLSPTTLTAKLVAAGVWTP